MKTLQYKGYQGIVEFEDGALFVRALHIDDVLVAQFENAKDAKRVFNDLIDGYLSDCQEFGREPTKPFKGSFNVRVNPELHRRAAMMSAECGVSLNAWVSEAISDKLDCDRLTDRVENAFALKIEEAQLIQSAKIKIQTSAKLERYFSSVHEIEKSAFKSKIFEGSRSGFNA